MEYWQRFTAEEAARKLNTDISLGRTTDKKRSLRRQGGSVFILPRADAGECVRSAMTDAAVMIFFVTAAVSMLVGALGEALVALALLFAACFVSGRMKFASRRNALRMAENLLPTVKLLSEGNVKDADCRELTAGDVIILLKGDVVPADCRLIYSSRLKVAEYFVDGATAKRRARAVDKSASALYGEGDERESYDNMIYAGSTVISGKCKALVVATGKDTRVAMVDSGIPLASGENMPPSAVGFSKNGRAFATAMLIAVLPITIIGTVCQPSDGLSIVSVFFIAVSLALTSFGELSSSAAEYILTKRLSTLDDGARINLPSRADSFAQADTLIILCESSVIDTERHVRRIFWNGAEKKGALTSGSMKPLAEKLDKLLAAAELLGATNPVEDCEALFDYVKSMGISRRWNLNDGKTATPKIDFPTQGALSAVVVDEKTVPQGKEIVSCASNAAMIRNCRRYRTANGEIKPMDQPLALKTVAAFNDYRAAGLSPYVITSAASVSEGMVLEAVIAVGVYAPKHNKDVAAELRANGVRPIFILPEENAESIYAANYCGIATASASNGGIAVASRFPEGVDFSQLLDEHSVFVGFGKNGTALISRALAEKGARAISVVLDSLDLRDTAPFGICLTVDGASPDSARLLSSASVRSASRTDKNSGFGAFSSIVRAARCARERLRTCGEYFITSAAFRALFVLLPIVAGMPAAVPRVPLILLTGLLGDLASAFVIAKSANATTSASITSLDNEKANKASSVFCAVSGIVLGALAAGVGMILSANGLLSAASYSSYALPTICFVQLAVLGVSLYKSHAELICPPFVVYAVFNALLCAIPYTLAYFTIPDIISTPVSMIFGTASAHKLVMLCAPVGALLTAADLLFVRKLTHGAMNFGFTKD